jgi:uncharacterized membrane protein YphA (DoxX/SURF4 family)
MNLLIRGGRAFFAIGIIGIALQQFKYGALRPVIFPEWPAGWQASAPAAYLVGLLLIAASVFILMGKNGEKASLGLAGFFLIMFLAFHFVSLVFFNPNSFHLGSWSNALKSLALAGGALIMAGSYLEELPSGAQKSPLGLMMEKMIPAGRIFFSITLIAFGIDHFIYTDFVATLVPAWIPGHLFWTYFAAIALIGSGLCIIFKIQLKTIAWLTAVMLLIWLAVLHIPRAIVAPPEDMGNELTSVFEALNFGGIAMVIAGLKKSTI